MDKYFLDLDPTDDNVIALTGTSQQYTLPTPGGLYDIAVIGNDAYINQGANPTMVIGNKGVILPNGTYVDRVGLSGPKLGIIAASAAGYLYIVERQ